MFSTDRQKEIDVLLDVACQNYKIPGMALAVYRNGEPIYQNYYGYRDVENGLKVDKNTIFGVASISKSLTCVAIMKLEDEGRLNATDKVTAWLPELKLPNKDYTEQLEIRHLMSHTAGFPGLPFINAARLESVRKDPDGEILFDGFPDDNGLHVVNPDDLIWQISHMKQKILGPPGSVFNYSNESYGILQKIIELASGKGYMEFVGETIFEPLALNDSCLLTDLLADRDNVTNLYAYKENGETIFCSPAWWDVGDIYANGSWKASSEDIMKYAEMLRLNGTYEHKQVISENSVKKMTTPFITLLNGESYGFGLEIDTIGAYTCFGHGGSIKGVSTNFQVIQEMGISASILINLSNVPAESILKDVLHHLLDISKETLHAEKTAYKVDEMELKKLPGYYSSEEGQKARVYFKENQLFLTRGTNKTTKLNAVSPNEFVSDAGDKIHFIHENNLVSAVFIGKRLLNRNSNYPV